MQQGREAASRQRVEQAASLQPKESDYKKFMRFARTRAPYFSLPREFYEEDVFRVDMSEIWSKSWLLAGLSCQIPKPNDYLSYNVGQNSVIITRGSDDVVRAFHNVCRHRGSRICRLERGSAAALVCPYHQWTYDPTSGSLKHARDMGEFNQMKGEYGLHPAHCRELRGLIWVSMPPPGLSPYFSFEEATPTLEAQMKHHGFERTKIAFSETYVVNANWKLVYENNRECYHCNKGHPEYIKANYDTAFSYLKERNGNITRIPDSESNRFQEATEQIELMTTKWQNQLGVACTSDSTFPGSGWYRATRNPMRKEWLVESLDGNRVCNRLMGNFDVPDMGSMRIHTFPNHWTHASSDHAVVTRLTPLAWNKTEAKVFWIVDEKAQEGEDYHRDKMTPFWALTSEQDWILAEDNHNGVMSPHYTPGPLSTLKEESVEKFIQWYLQTTKGMIGDDREREQENELIF